MDEILNDFYKRQGYEQIDDQPTPGKKEHAAATKIQKVFRGGLARLKVGEQLYNERRNEAAKKIQETFRKSPIATRSKSKSAIEKEVKKATQRKIIITGSKGSSSK
jgi:CO dehydrogenase/acetyl-CoA synthase epsilon subunit